MHAIVNIAIKAVRNSSNLVVKAIDDLDSGSINPKNRHKYTAEVATAANERIRDTILDAYPDHIVIDSQMSETMDYADDDYIWLIDAINGVTNYAHGYPQFAMTVAVKHKNRVQHGVIYDPMRQDLFATTRGAGSFLNDHRIRVSSQKTLDKALIASTKLQLLSGVDGVRNSGATALDLAYVATGRIDGFFGTHLTEFDMAAGALMILEAGGLVGDFTGKENHIETGNVVAGNPKIFKAILQNL